MRIKVLKPFASLLNPFVLDKSDISSTGRQQREASIRFPDLVRNSSLSLYDSEDFVLTDGPKLVLGVAASFSLADAYLADLLSQFSFQRPTTTTFVFDLSGMASINELSKIFPGFSDDYPSPPIAGLWNTESLNWVKAGSDARETLLEYFKIPVSNAELMAELKTLSPQFFDC